ncbi:GTP-binding protein Obg/CgtA [Coemansia reversa NRRL 1564]|uniref:GTP-binding protein Obg/CgtA n=1 Tax=Coemansia reversa (strain ATCC 12441 / NRRL 1564) TaxID=763665 RepID=A0A2G5BB50_COERN|nr:GTP-binding protein Obg/CgtA [Coemansia reversa NRRL 1564]|eukprot:PIA16244.1 GTP-binding protein Obg/CgtA [Coemansia reversa NRRL 1564]
MLSEISCRVQKAGQAAWDKTGAATCIRTQAIYARRRYKLAQRQQIRSGSSDASNIKANVGAGDSEVYDRSAASTTLDGSIIVAERSAGEGQQLRPNKSKLGQRNFVDYIRCTTIAGRGGDGCASFFRDMFVPRGPPNGGDGGNGGDIWFVVDENETSLNCVKRQLKATAGVNGKGKSMHGSRGADLIVRVPKGTILDHPEPLSVDLVSHGQRAHIAKGGLGGFGNPRFISSSERQPHYALRGLMGQRRELELELKTIADVGLVGMPNAGKSTFLGAVSNAHPKIASYPFTTLNPYIGTVEFRDTFQITVADIPGLIPGAHRNVGLGHSFLRHVERSRVLAFIVDVSRESPWNDLEALQTELNLYSPGLSDRPSLVIANKADLGTKARDNFEKWQAMTSVPIVPISAKFNKNILKATYTIRQILGK